MIRMKIDTKASEKLVNKLKQLQQDILNEGNYTVRDLDNILQETYESSVDELVYDQYSPQVYQRTLHLRGAHGAIVKDVELKGYNKTYTFRINENSRDPIDGETWKEKAFNVENGASQMSVGFNRPFIAPTQRKLEYESEKIKKHYIDRVRSFIRKAGK